MKTVFAKSFFKSLKDINNPITTNYYRIRNWITYHFNKDFFGILKTAFSSYPWDYDYLYYLEKAKIEEMMNYHIKRNSFEGTEYAVRDMRICMNLIDIITGKTKLFTYHGKLQFIEIENTGNYEMKNDDLKKEVLVHVNTKNVDRFVDDERKREFYRKYPEDFYQLKARHLYHKIRLENDTAWWD